MQQSFIDHIVDQFHILIQPDVFILQSRHREQVLDHDQQGHQHDHDGERPSALAEHAQELRDDPSCELMIKALWNYNYGPWMKAMIENTKCSSRGVELEW